MTQEIRPWFGRVLTVVIATICAAVTISVAITDGWSEAVRTAPWTALVALLCWATFWRPRVVVSDGGVRVVNVTRTVDIAWPALRDVRTKWALTLETAYGQVTAWSAPAPGARTAMRSAVLPDRQRVPRTQRRAPPTLVVAPGDLIDSPSGSAAATVRDRWDALRAAGHLDDARLERERPVVAWHVGTAACALGLAIAGILGVVV